MFYCSLTEYTAPFQTFTHSRFASGFQGYDKHSPDLGRDVTPAACLAPEGFKRSISAWPVAEKGCAPLVYLKKVTTKGDFNSVWKR